MADANAVAGPSIGHPTARPRSRIHFSDDQSSSEPEASPRPSRASTHSPVMRKFPQISNNVADSSRPNGDERKRVHSQGAKTDTTSPYGTVSTRKSVDIARGGRAGKDLFSFGNDTAMDVFGPGALSDEYDLCMFFLDL